MGASTPLPLFPPFPLNPPSHSTHARCSQCVQFLLATKSIIFIQLTQSSDYCIVLYLYIYIALLAVHTNQISVLSG